MLSEVAHEEAQRLRSNLAQVAQELGYGDKCHGSCSDSAISGTQTQHRELVQGLNPWTSRMDARVSGQVRESLPALAWEATTQQFGNGGKWNR